jgi:phosphoglycerate dehydrogenase-like enzyme
LAYALRSVIHVHIWDKSDWNAYLTGLLAGDAICTFGEDVPAKTEVLVKGRPFREDLERLPNLRAVVIPWAGVPVPTRELLMEFPKVSLYNLHHNSADTAEMALALYFAVAKRIVNRDNNLRKGMWSEDTFGRGGSSDSIRADGKRALVLGYGSIGRIIGRVCAAMGMQVTGVRRTGPFDNDVRPISELDDLLPNADALFIALPLTPETEGLLDEKRLKLLPSRAILVNIGRAAITHEEGLYNLLKEGRIGGAGLDVWWKYPGGSDEPCFPSNFPYHELPNVAITPHVGGSSDASEEHRWRALADLVKGIAAGTAKAASVQDGY